ncbi:MAG: DUF4080 domain-containing protein [Bdellovibrionales bacterium]|nr:DUF4080 domain-containing protein [Bdellovibrionales bacterium]
MARSVAQNDIVLSTLNARFIHAAFGLRYLQANLGPLQARSEILEFTIQQSASIIAEEILSRSPRIVGFGVYIWNTVQTLEVVRALKSKNKELVIILGGPEVSHESDEQEIVELADHTIRGEADLLFRQVCERLLSAESDQKSGLSLKKIIDGPLPDLQLIHMPYSLYSDTDIKNRVIYVEASRGCAFKCEYCLSSLDLKVRSFPIQEFLHEMSRLIERGARSFKFVDRTFNLSPRTSTQILEFFLSKSNLGIFLHFEMVPDRLPLEIRELIQKFPEGSLQFEVGIQTWNPQVAALVSRKQDMNKIDENLQFLRESTGVHIHADLIAGLPGETLESFAQGFNHLVRLRPHEVQLGILKRLRGTPIIRHDQEWGMRYSKSPPYEIQETKLLSPQELLALKRASKYWDLISNRGYFKKTAALIFNRSPFEDLTEISDFLWARFGKTHSIDLMKLAEAIWIFLVDVRNFPRSTIHDALLFDLQIPQLRPIPDFLRSQTATNDRIFEKKRPGLEGTPKRQRRFLGTDQ